MFDKGKASPAEKALQKKALSSLGPGDRAAVQARLRATQRNHYEGRTIGVPSGVENWQPAPNVGGLIQEMQATANGMSKGGGWGSDSSFQGVIPEINFGPDLETKIRALNTGNTSAAFTKEQTFNYSLVQSWKVIYTGSFSVGPLHMVGPGTAGSGGGGTSQGSAGGSNQGAASGSANSAGGTGGAASGPASGSVSGGTANSTGGNTANSGGANGGASQSSGGANTRETYSGVVTATWSVRIMPDGFLTGLAHDGSRSGPHTTADCGSVTFTVPVT